MALDFLALPCPLLTGTGFPAVHQMDYSLGPTTPKLTSFANTTRVDPDCAGLAEDLILNLGSEAVSLESDTISQHNCQGVADALIWTARCVRSRKEI